MNTIIALERMRDLARWLDCVYVTEENGRYKVYASKLTDGMKSAGENLRDLCDDVEREVFKSCMPLPLDADGVPIRFGDYVDDGSGVPIEVMSFTYFEDCCDVNLCGMNPKLLRHVKPRTIEDVLRDVVTLCANTWKDGLSVFSFCDVSDVMKSENIKDFADEIRELMGGGECKIIGSSTNDLLYTDHMTKWYELSCGHNVTLNDGEPPRFCPSCGKAVKR